MIHIDPTVPRGSARYCRMLMALRRRRDAARRRNPGHAAARAELYTPEDCRRWRARHGLGESAFRASLARLHAIYWALEARCWPAERSGQ